jgi:hypothetical protein
VLQIGKQETGKFKDLSATHVLVTFLFVEKQALEHQGRKHETELKERGSILSERYFFPGPIWLSLPCCCHTAVIRASSTYNDILVNV